MLAVLHCEAALTCSSITSKRRLSVLSDVSSMYRPKIMLRWTGVLRGFSLSTRCRL